MATVKTGRSADPIPVPPDENEELDRDWGKTKSNWRKSKPAGRKSHPWIRNKKKSPSESR